MKPVDVTLRPTQFEENGQVVRSSELKISLSVEPAQVQVPGRARVLVRVLREGRPLDGFRVSISSSRGRLSSCEGSTSAGVLAAELRGRPEDVGHALVRVHSDCGEDQAVLSAGLEFVR